MFQISVFRTVALLACLLLSSSSYALHVSVVFDSNDKEVGTLEVYTGFGRTSRISTEKGDWIEINHMSGEVEDQITTYYENADCTGQAYISGDNSNNYVGHIIRTYTDAIPANLFLIPAQAETGVDTALSLMNNAGCQPTI